jgi:hypothetical protein
MTASHHSSTPTGRPAKKTLWLLALGVLLAHLAVLLGLGDAQLWRLQDPLTRVGAMQTRTIASAAASPASLSTPKPQTPSPTRIAQVVKPPVSPVPSSGATAAAQSPNLTATATPDEGTQAPGEATPDASAATPSAAAMANIEPDPPNAVAQSPIASPATEVSPQDSPAVIPSAPIDSKPATITPADQLASATTNLPGIPLGMLPPSTLLSYRLTGQEKGIQYSASGSLSWQHNEARYDMGLTVKAFLLGSRQWRSQGQIAPTGLLPIRFSDSWRSERASHFDHAGQRIVFSSNAPTAVLQAGAQDQISLYVQLAAAMAADGARFVPGTRLQIQIATIRDALPWLLTLDKVETIIANGVDLSATKWVCQPRNRFDAQVEFWVAREHQWLPVRIRITQVNGNFIDLNLIGQTPLPPLALGNTPG